jgi:hypothetical protein
MQKSLLFILINIYLLANSNLLLELKPAVGSSQSEYRIVKSLPGKSEAKSIKGETKGIGDANYVIQYDNVWLGGYYCPRPSEDTFAVRFVPPASCSLVAFTWIGYNTTTGAVGAPVGVFAKMYNPAADYSTFSGVCDYDGTELSPMGRLLFSAISSAPGNMVWDTVNIDPPIEVWDSTFFCGYSGVNVLDTVACLCENLPYTGDPFDVHTYQFNEDGAGGAGGWFAYYYTTCGLAGTYMNAGIRAYVKAYENIKPNVVAENLPNSYDTGDRTVSIYGYDFGPDSSAVVVMELYYQVNGGGWSMISSNTPVTGTVGDGIWEIDIPGVGVGDVVEYYVVGKDWVDAADTAGIFTYEIKTGDSGDFLYVKNDDDPADILPEYWLDDCDVWDVAAEGNYPDGSVLAFYNTVIWRDWGCLGLGPGANYGIGGYGVRHSDSTAIKTLLDNGGNFWLSDQDLGYGLGIIPYIGHGIIPPGDWVRVYLGIIEMIDDGPLAGAPVTVYGDSLDPIIGDLFKGVGYQNPGELYIQPEYAWIGNFDSLDATAVTNMLAAGGEVVSFRFEGGVVHNGKVFCDFYPFDYIKNPADTTEFDRVAVDSLVSDVLGWFGYTSGVSDRTIEPERVIKLLPLGIVKNKVMIRFYLPEEKTVNLSIYDKTGRSIKNIKNGKANAGLNSVRWDGKDSYGNPVSSGIYFCQLRTGDKTLTDKFIVIR